MPLTTLVGDVRTSEFTVNVRNRYFLELEAQKTIPLEQLDCLLDVKDPPSQDCSKLPSLVNVKWELYSDGTIAQSGSSADSVYGGWSNDSVYRDLGYFSGMPGHRYQIELHFVTDATQLSVTSPRFRVSVTPVFIETILFTTIFMVYPTTGVLVFTGIVLLSISVFRWRVPRNRTEVAASGVQ